MLRMRACTANAIISVSGGGIRMTTLDRSKEAKARHVLVRSPGLTYSMTRYLNCLSNNRGNQFIRLFRCTVMLTALGCSLTLVIPRRPHGRVQEMSSSSA